jgi:2-oxoglutarate ferredoxin oxidoreductase subunit beta
VKKVFERPRLLKPATFHFCPGCGHNILHRVIAEVMEESDFRDRAIMIAPVGCAVLSYFYLDIDVTEAPHGRCTAVATGIKRAIPNSLVLTYQGDGDLASIGAGETLHAAGRGEKVTTVYVNNTNYGMTGGQMAPTTMLNQSSTTCSAGRTAEKDGYPLDLSKLLSTLPGVCYVERVALTSPANVLKFKKALRKAFQYQTEGLGYSLIEVLSACPTNWKLSPVDSLKWIEDVMTKAYPPGVLVDRKGDPK